MKPYIQGVADEAVRRGRMLSSDGSGATDPVVKLDEIAEDNRSRPSARSNPGHMFHYYFWRPYLAIGIVTPGQFTIAGVLYSIPWVIPIMTPASAMATSSSATGWWIAGVMCLFFGVFGSLKIGLGLGALAFGVRKDEDHSEELARAEIIEEAMDRNVLYRAGERMYWTPR